MRSPVLLILDSAQLLDALDIHQALGRLEVLLHEADLVGATGQHVRLAPLVAEHAQSFLQGCRICVFEGLHLRIPPFERRQHPVGRQRNLRHPHADGIGRGVRDRRD